MQNKLLFSFLVGSTLLGLTLEAHRDHVYVYEAAPVVVAPGPVVYADPTPAVYVNMAPSAPPAAQVEIQTVSPGPGYSWTPGYWNWTDRWVWVGGTWAPSPYAGARWESGHWDYHHHHDRWVWKEGHWH